MNWNAPKMLRRVRDLPSHLHELAANLAVLSRETQERIAETVATTIAQIVRDGLHRYWCNPGQSQPMLRNRVVILIPGKIRCFKTHGISPMSRTSNRNASPSPPTNHPRK